MKSKFIVTITSLLILAFTFIGIISCAPPQKDAPEKQITEIKRGDLQVAVTADGNLVMPHQVKLRFGTPGTVKYIFVKEGDKVKGGTLLAKLDDTMQKLAVTSALYDVELALNELAERVYPSLLGYPSYYPSTSVVLRVEQAQSELKQSQTLLEQSKRSDAVAKLRVAQYDLTAGIDTLKTTLKDMETYPFVAGDYSLPDNSYVPSEPVSPNIKDLITMIEQDLKALLDVQSSIEKGDLPRALALLKTEQQSITQTYSLTQRICGQVVMRGISYPDTSTSLDSLKAAESNLKEIQKVMEKGNYDAAELAKILRMAQHDMEISRDTLENNELVLKHGLNLKVLRQNNLTLQKYQVALQRYKEELLKTEILAPFDGTVVNIGVKENDQLSAYDYSTITAVHLVDTKTVELDGVVDEIDIFKVKVGQKATIVVDALPEQKLTGTVTFISPFGTEKTGVVNYKITIKLDPTEMELKGGLTATANIVVDSKKNVLLIPNGAIKGTRGNYWTQVFTGRTKDEIEKRPITLGLQSESFSEVVSGIKEGEKVLVEKPATTTRSPLNP